MNETPVINKGRCSCGDVAFELSQPPLLRAYCHCTICQKFNNADFSDVSVYYAKGISGLDEGAVDFKVYKQPPLVRRGACSKCGDPVIEKVNIPLMPRLFIVPSKNHENATLLPESAMHIFYDTRVKDADDGLKKYTGFVASQLAFTLALIKGMLSRR